MATKSRTPKAKNKGTNAVQSAKRLELMKRLYALAGKPDKVEEFERVRKELDGLL